MKREKIVIRQRELFAEKILDWGNLVFVGLVIAQFVPQAHGLRYDILIAGMMLLGLAYLAAYLLTRRGDKNE